MFLSFVLLMAGIYADGAFNASYCFVSFVDSCDESCATDVLAMVNATYVYRECNSSLTAVLDTIPDESWDMIVMSDEVTSAGCDNCFVPSLDPVCGSNDVSYYHSDHLECATSWCHLEDGEEPVTVVKEGPCKAELHCDGCPNTRMLPINVWFTKSCNETCVTSILDSVNAVDYDLTEYNHTIKAQLHTDLSDETWDVLLETEYVAMAKCQDECITITLGIEEIDNNPLCGSDGHTYANQNDLDCAVGNFCPGEEPITVVKNGPCDCTDPDCVEEMEDASSMLTAATSLVLLLSVFA